MVKATEKSGDTIVDTIQDLQVGIVLAIRENTDRLMAYQSSLHQEFMEVLKASIHETRELRIVSS